MSSFNRVIVPIVSESNSNGTSDDVAISQDSDEQFFKTPKRSHRLIQEDMIVVCTTESDREILPDRPVSFTDLDYRQDLKADLFNEREIQIISNAVACEAHIICLSCVESERDVQEARRVLKKARGHHLQIYSKIQSLKGLANID